MSSNSQLKEYCDKWWPDAVLHEPKHVVDYVSVTIYSLVYDVDKPEEKLRWKEMALLYR
jgi:hypothetical protein